LTKQLTDKIQLDAGLRLSGAITQNAGFLILEPRLRLAFDPGGTISPHINYVRLSQFDHSIEGSNTGLRTMLWLPVSKDFGRRFQMFSPPVFRDKSKRISSGPWMLLQKNSRDGGL